jgi:hypothetical protein
MPAMSGSSPGNRGLFARLTYASWRRSNFIFCFSCRARSLCRFCWDGRDLFAMNAPKGLIF